LLDIGSQRTLGRWNIQSRLFIALPILLALSSCSEEIQAQNQPLKPPDEIRAGEATELPGTEGEAEAPNIELRDPVGLD
jgi:hypothetical protein